MPYKDKQKQIETRKLYYSKHKAEIIENNRIRRSKNPWLFSVKNKISQFKVRYGIILKEDDFIKLHNEKGSSCNICGVILTHKSLSLDHCHTTNKIRGFLCDKCNLGLTSLPGYAPKGGVQNKAGLSTQPVEPVGFKVSEELKPLQDKANSMDKKTFTDLFDKGLKSQNMTVRQTAENMFTAISKLGLNSVSDFYDKVTQVSAPITKAIEQPTQIPKTTQETALTPEQKLSEVYKPSVNSIVEKTPEVKVSPSSINKSINPPANKVTKPEDILMTIGTLYLRR